VEDAWRLLMDVDEKKLLAARAALNFIPPGTTLGVGTGSTVNHLIGLLPTVRDRIDRLVSSSRATTGLLSQQGFEVSTLNEAGGVVDVYVDGADEANKRLHLVKGGGGALTREKVLAGAARRFVCIVDDSKLVGMLGAFPLPIEVLPMAQEFVAGKLGKMRGRPVWRDGFVTDNGNHILDVHGLQISNPIELETRLNQIPGIVAVGLFANRPADILLIAADDGIRELRA
jgi:ribose 5-phosphate isomerase A